MYNESERVTERGKLDAFVVVHLIKKFLVTVYSVGANCLREKEKKYEIILSSVTSSNI